MVFHSYTHLGSKRNFRIARVNAPTLQFKVSFLENLNKTETDLSQFWVEIRKHFFYPRWRYTICAANDLPVNSIFERSLRLNSKL